jgi:sugar lactone lactonase YvrE
MAEGGAVLETVETSQPCFACMLGGEDGRTLFLLTAPDPDSARRAAAREGRLEFARVAFARAGLP